MIAYADSYDLVHAESAPAQRYGDDLLLANWNPALAALAALREGDGSDHAGRESIEEDLDGFLDRVYALASHI
jgi:hypothetical protein